MQSLLRMSLYGGVLILFVLLLRLAALNKLSKRVFMALWDVALIRLLLPWFITVPVPATLSFMAPRDANDFGTAAGSSSAASYDPAVSASSGAVSPSGSIGTRLYLLIWAAGVAVLATAFIISWAKFLKEFKTSLPVEPGSVKYPTVDAPGRQVQIRCLKGISTPLTYGIFRPVILLPKDPGLYDENQLDYILYHEAMHIRHFDTLRKLVAAAALCVHWFNPAVWLFFVFFNRDIELRCDECVVDHFGGAKRKDYALALLNIERQRGKSAPFGSYFGKNSTEERIKAIMKNKKHTGKTFIFVIAAAFIAAALVFVSCSAPKQDDFSGVLDGSEEFTFVGEEGTQTMTVNDIPKVFDPDEAFQTKIWQYCLVDLDGDGGDEAVLSVYGAAGDAGGQILLHQDGDEFYGYKTDQRTLVSLKADGTGEYSDPTGVKEFGICKVEEFTQTGYTLDKITYAKGDETKIDTYVVDHATATEEEYSAANEEQSSKADVEWLNFESPSSES